MPGPADVPGVEPRSQVLRDAERLITTDRNRTYGSPTQNFTDIAAVWTTYLAPKLRPGVALDPPDVSWLMVLLKAMRDRTHRQRDNYVDTAGYAGCGWEAGE